MMKTACLILWLLSGTVAIAADSPHIGFAYPAGGQRGTEFEVTVGGQYLGGTTNVLISGEGATAEVLDYTIRYEERAFRGLYRRKNNLEATIAERKEKGESYDKEQGQLNQLLRRLSLADLPEGVEAEDMKQVLRSYRNQTKEQFNPQIAERLRLRVTIADTARPGERELRLRTSTGLSNPLYFKVGVLPESTEKEPNDDHMEPGLQTLPTPSIINGQIRPGDIDHFRFRTEKGEAIVVDVAARRIIPYLADAVPGWFQAVAAIYDEDGNEVAYDDDFKFNPDPVLFYKIPESGIYTLSIRDAIYRGREDFVYRIAIGELPFITGIFPLGGQQGQTAGIMLNGWNLPQTKISGTLPHNPGSIRQVSVSKDDYRSNGMPFAIDDLVEAIEIEPNDAPATAQTVEIPLIVNGRIQTPNERDIYAFHGEQGQTVSIGVAARRLHSPLDSLLTLTGPGLENPLRNDDYTPKQVHLHLGAGLVTHHADSYLLQKLPETGTYFIEVSDTQAKGGPDFAYRLRIAPARPDFTLRMEPSGLQIAPGGTAVFTVRATRMEGFDGAIAISATNLPAGFRIHHAEIPAGGESALVTLTAPDQIEAGVLTPDITGTASIDGALVTRTAVAVDDQMQAFLYRHLVPARELTLTSDSTPSPISFEARLPRSGIIELPLGREKQIPLKGFVHTKQQGTAVSIDQPPEGLSIIKGWIGRNKGIGPKNPQAGGRLVVKAEAPLEPGDRITLIPVAIMKKGREETRFPAPAITVTVVPGQDGL